MKHDLILYSFMFNQAHSHGGGGQGTKGSLGLRISLAPKVFFLLISRKRDNILLFFFFDCKL